jgi:hypothetical protein
VAWHQGHARQMIRVIVLVAVCLHSRLMPFPAGP